MCFRAPDPLDPSDRSAKRTTLQQQQTNKKHGSVWMGPAHDSATHLVVNVGILINAATCFQLLHYKDEPKQSIELVGVEMKRLKLLN